MSDVFITKTAAFLPNSVVTNDEIEDYLGLINGRKSKSKNIVLRSNRIKERYYAIDKNGKSTHNNAELTSNAIRNLFIDEPEKMKDVELLCCGTSSPDQIMPSHGVMVHGFLPEMGIAEVLSPAGNCCTGMHGLKYAYMSLKLGEKNKAVCTGSERVSRQKRCGSYEEELDHLESLENKPSLAFEKDFLRWMLSDGAGSFLLETRPATEGHSLKVEWVDSISYANQEKTCMYQGASIREDGNLNGYSDLTPKEWLEDSVFSMKQDAKLLDNKIVELFCQWIPELIEKHKLSSDDVTYFLPHMSSFYFEEKIHKQFADAGLPFAKEKWFTNLSTKGNVGAGSIYLMVDELLKSDKLNKGDKIILMVPESARFSYVISLLTVV